MSHIDFRWALLKKNFLSSFSENHDKSQKRLFFKTSEKWVNDEKMPPMVILGQHKYNNSIKKNFQKICFQFFVNH